MKLPSDVARIRSIWPEACKSQRLASISAEAERCYWRLQTHCDDEGRCEDSVRLIWAALFPLHEDVTPEAVDQWLEELGTAELIERYKINDGLFIAVTQWGRFQHPQRRKPSIIPPPSRNGNGGVADASATSTRQVSLGEGEGIGEGEGGSARKRAARALPDDWEPSEKLKSWLREEYPAYARRGVVESFKDHYRKTGRAFKDWDAAFRNWVRQEAKFHPAPEAKGPARTFL